MYVFPDICNGLLFKINLNTFNPKAIMIYYAEQFVQRTYLIIPLHDFTQSNDKQQGQLVFPIST